MSLCEQLWEGGLKVEEWCLFTSAAQPEEDEGKGHQLHCKVGTDADSVQNR